jgi:hypothetical protein
MGKHRRRSGPALWITTLLISILPSDRGKQNVNPEMTEVREDTESTVPVPLYIPRGTTEDPDATHPTETLARN